MGVKMSIFDTTSASPTPSNYSFWLTVAGTASLSILSTCAVALTMNHLKKPAAA